MKTYTKCCKGLNGGVSEDIRHGITAGVACGVLCWTGINALVFCDNAVFGAAILLIGFISMVCGIMHFS